MSTAKSTPAQLTPVTTLSPATEVTPATKVTPITPATRTATVKRAKPAALSAPVKRATQATAFTPGPWNRHREYNTETEWSTVAQGTPEEFRNWYGCLAAEDTILATFQARVSNGGYPTVQTIEEAQANLNLCIAAPAMFAALQRAEAVLKAQQEGHGEVSYLVSYLTMVELVDEVLGAVRGALAQARGEELGEAGSEQTGGAR